MEKNTRVLSYRPKKICNEEGKERGSKVKGKGGGPAPSRLQYKQREERILPRKGEARRNKPEENKISRVRLRRKKDSRYQRGIKITRKNGRKNAAKRSEKKSPSRVLSEQPLIKSRGREKGTDWSRQRGRKLSEKSPQPARRTRGKRISKGQRGDRGVRI